MTKWPADSKQVTGLQVDEAHPAHKVGPTCAAPDCRKLTDHAHHLFSRGLMGGDFKWVRLEDGTEVFNLSPLCYKHHEQITNNQTAIRWVEDQFVWINEDGEVTGPLTWQPYKISVEPHEEHVIETIPRSEAMDLGATPRRQCPTCKRKYREHIHNDFDPKNKEEKRRRMTWAVAVPVDKAENGFIILDELMQGCIEKMEEYGLEWGEGKRNRYFALSTVLALFLQHGDQILSDG